MRKLAVYSNNVMAGVLTENQPGREYEFTYNTDYLLSYLPPISATLPKRAETYQSEYLFPFFTNLLPEGANRKVICREKHIDEHDFFGMLIATVGTDIIGAVNFRHIDDDRN